MFYFQILNESDPFNIGETILFMPGMRDLRFSDLLLINPIFELQKLVFYGRKKEHCTDFYVCKNVVEITDFYSLAIKM
jgi:hypothetical protein